MEVRCEVGGGKGGFLKFSLGGGFQNEFKNVFMSYIILYLVGGKSMLAAMITHFFMFTLLTLNIF